MLRVTHPRWMKNSWESPGRTKTLSRMDESDVKMGLGQAIVPALWPVQPLKELTSSLHLMARENKAAAIRNYVMDKNIQDVKRAAMEKDGDDNTPPMVAALNNNKEALMALLGIVYNLYYNLNAIRLGVF